MNITAINCLNSVFGAKQQKGSNDCSKHFGLVMAKPLLKDTVSFKATPKGANKCWEANGVTVRQVRQKLKSAFKKVDYFVNNTFGDLVVSEKEPNNPITSLCGRLKTEFSIQEKTGTGKWSSVQEILENMTDLIGYKIELRDSNKQSVDNVLSRLIPAIKSRDAEIIEIENKRPAIVRGLEEHEASKYDYPSINMLNKLSDIQNAVWKEGKAKQKVRLNLFDDLQPSNYCATHMLIRLPGKNPVTFELQIIGHNVNLAKHVDDPVYKKLAGKDPKINSEKFNKIFLPLTDEKFFADEPNAKQIIEEARSKFNKYRADMFLFQREKADLTYRKNKRPERFLPIQYQLFPDEIAMKYDLDSIDYDYNNIAELLLKAEKSSTKKAKTKKINTNSETIV